MRRMFKSAMVDELIVASPIVVEKGTLPKNVDKDPSWRASAIFDRGELVRLITDERIPDLRRMQDALKGLAALRHGEAAGRRWSDYDTTCTPLGKLVIARSYEKSTKTQVTREVPVHPVLAAMLQEWREVGWRRMFGRAPKADDLVIPGLAFTPRLASNADNDFAADLKLLGMRHRRGHDLRRTFVTLAQVEGRRGTSSR
jgi:integrase